MPQVHPTAVVDPSARLADDVCIGPLCVIEGEVELGPGCRLEAQVFMKGPMAAGANNHFYPNTYIGHEPQDRGFDPRRLGAGVTIGRDNIFREGVSVHRATGDAPTTVGDDNYLMVNAHLGHDTVIGHHNTLANGVLLGGHVQLADHCVLGGNAVVHQFVRIGRLSMISGVAGLTQDMPPFCVCYTTRSISSLNIVGLRRAGYRGHVRHLKAAFDILFLQRHANHVAAELIEQRFTDDPLCREFAGFVRETHRGITPYLGGRAED